jgi:AcrR family transcriptional regulator
VSTSSEARPTYHHGNLPAALLDAAAALVQERGVAGTSLREVARRAGVSHSAPAHHFGDKAGLLTAVAREGFRRFLAALTEADEAFADRPGKRFVEVGVAYVRFAVENPAYFAVMWRSDVQDPNDAAVAEFAAPAFEILRRNVADLQAGGWRSDDETLTVAVGCWSIAHGLATLWLEGALASQSPLAGSEIEPLARQIIGGVLGAWADD